MKNLIIIIVTILSFSVVAKVNISDNVKVDSNMIDIKLEALTIFTDIVKVQHYEYPNHSSNLVVKRLLNLSILIEYCTDTCQELIRTDFKSFSSDRYRSKIYTYPFIYPSFRLPDDKLYDGEQLKITLIEYESQDKTIKTINIEKLRGKGKKDFKIENKKLKLDYNINF